MTPTERADLLALYAEVDAAIVAANPRCEASGRCCRFVEFDHTLFLTSFEAELLFEPGIPAEAALDPGLCPYQVHGLCTARDRRPTGCRVYFCDPAWQELMPMAAEEAIARLKVLHQRHGRGWDYRPLNRHPPLAERLAAAPNNPLPILPAT
jgi:hypothetical protein